MGGKFPGYLSPSLNLKFADVPNGLAAISKVPAAGWAQIFLYGGFCELSQDQSPGTAAYVGDFGFKAITSDDPANRTKELNAEIANGRLAMMAIIGMFFQDGLTGSAWGDWALYTASPLRAAAAEDAPPPMALLLFLISGGLELAVWTQDPKKEPGNFGDPLGLGMYDEEMRNKEINNGRFAMFAALGIIAADLATGKDAMQQFGL